MFENKKIFIFGMARSGYEAAKLLANYNNEIVITDGKEQNIEHVKELESLGVKEVITENQIDLIDDETSELEQLRKLYQKQIYKLSRLHAQLTIMNYQS